MSADRYMQHLYQHYGLSANVTAEELQSVARTLLSSSETEFYGAELILGRRIDARETDIVRLFSSVPPDQAIDRLLSRKAVESEAANGQ